MGGTAAHIDSPPSGLQLRSARQNVELFEALMSMVMVPQYCAPLKPCRGVGEKVGRECGRKAWGTCGGKFWEVHA